MNQNPQKFELRPSSPPQKKRRIDSQSEGDSTISKPNLPILNYSKTILHALDNNQVLIIQGKTGCGKTTQIPQIVFEGGWCSSANSHRLLGVTQPRRVSCISLSTRVAQEMDVPLGSTVGYIVQFEKSCDEFAMSATNSSNSSAYDETKSKIVFMTEGILLNEILEDPFLTKYGVVMVDEVHERSVVCDLLLGCLRKICRKRPDLKLIVTSATMNLEKFLDYFHNDSINLEPGRGVCSLVVEESGEIREQANRRMILFAKEPVTNYVLGAYQVIENIFQRKLSETLEKNEKSSNPDFVGHILVFLPGEEDILLLQSVLQENLTLFVTNFLIEQKQPTRGKGREQHPFEEENQNDLMFTIIPFYASLTLPEQQRVFQKFYYYDSMKGKTVEKVKIIVSTNIAESSLTIQDIQYVIDSGIEKQKFFFLDKEEEEDNQETGIGGNKSIKEVKNTSEIASEKFISGSGSHGGSGMEILEKIPISKEKAIQRAGRAGRTIVTSENSKNSEKCACFRLYTEDFYVNHMPDSIIPEAQRVEITRYVLYLKSLGIDNFLKQFLWLDAPHISQFVFSLERLLLMGAFERQSKPAIQAPQLAQNSISVTKRIEKEKPEIVDSYSLKENMIGLTRDGSLLARLPLNNLHFGKILIESGNTNSPFHGGCSLEMARIVAIFAAAGSQGAVNSAFFSNRKTVERLDRIKNNFAVAEGDAIALLNISMEFTKRGKSGGYQAQKKWCEENLINHKFFKKVEKIDERLRQLLQRFQIPLVSVKDQPLITESEQNPKKKAGFGPKNEKVSEIIHTERLQKCILLGLFENIARRNTNDEDGSYRRIGVVEDENEKLYIHPSSFLFKTQPEYICFTDILVTKKVFMRDTMKIDPKWPCQLFGNLYSMQRIKVWD